MPYNMPLLLIAISTTVARATTSRIICVQGSHLRNVDKGAAQVPNERLYTYLGASFLADDGLQISHDGGERVGADRGSDEVVRVLDVGNPVPHCLIDRVLESAAPGLDRHHLPHPTTEKQQEKKRSAQQHATAVL